MADQRINPPWSESRSGWIVGLPKVKTWQGRKQNHTKHKEETIFLSSPSLALCYYSFYGAFGSFKRNFTGTKWFCWVSPINRETATTSDRKTLDRIQCWMCCLQWKFRFTTLCDVCVRDFKRQIHIFCASQNNTQMYVGLIITLVLVIL